MSRGFGRAALALGIGVAAALVAEGISSVQLFDSTAGRLEYQTIDYRMRSADRASADESDVVLVLFDSASVQGWPYLTPFPRSVLAQLIDVVSAHGARAIGLDVFLDRRYPELNALDGGDDALRDAIARAGNVVLVAPTVGSDTLRQLLPPDPFFADVAAAVSTADLPTPFETIRESALLTATRAGLVPGFALALYAEAQNVELPALLEDAARTGTLDVATLPAGMREVPVRGTHTVPILFAGPPSRAGADNGAFRAYSAQVVQLLGAVNPDALDAWLRDKIVLLGSGFHDSERFRTPFYDQHPEGDREIYGWTYGVEVHASALDNLLTGAFPVPLSWPARITVLLLCSILVAATTFRFGVKWGAAAAVVAIAATWVLAVAVFYGERTVVPMVAPAMAVLFSFVASTSWVSIVEGREKRVIRGAFSKYVPADVVDELVAHPERLQLGGEKRTITILFSDLAGFTALSERIEPELLVAVLNEYLDEMTDIVFAEGGTLDKYIGDAVMAFWNAPRELPDHAARACRAALGMQQKLAELNGRWRERGVDVPSLSMRIGVNTGSPVVGNIGGEKRFNYTTLGDSVNLAARLEPACKTYGVAIMIAEPTRVAAGDAIRVRELDMLAVYGKAEPVRVYELLSAASAPGAVSEEVLKLYEQGMASYRLRDFALALRYFEAALQVDPEDGPSALYAERCREHAVNPPPADWDFVERRQVK